MLTCIHQLVAIIKIEYIENYTIRREIAVEAVYFG